MIFQETSFFYFLVLIAVFLALGVSSYYIFKGSSDKAKPFQILAVGSLIILLFLPHTFIPQSLTTLSKDPSGVSNQPSWNLNQDGMIDVVVFRTGYIEGSFYWRGERLSVTPDILEMNRRELEPLRESWRDIFVALETRMEVLEMIRQLDQESVVITSYFSSEEMRTLYEIDLGEENYFLIYQLNPYMTPNQRLGLVLEVKEELIQRYRRPSDF